MRHSSQAWTFFRTNKLPDGTDRIVTTKNHIARASSDRIYNERRRLVSTAYRGEPDLLSAHVFDPSSRLNIFWDPYTRLAREAFLPAPPTASGAQQAAHHAARRHRGAARHAEL